MASLEIAGVVGASEVSSSARSVVYAAVQPEMDRWVAVKVLVGSKNDSDLDRRAHLLLLAMGRLLFHPHVPTLYTSGWLPDGRPYFLMEYLPRGSAASVLAKKGPFDWVTATFVAIKMAGALETAHRSGILHGDLKPENIIYSEYNLPKLVGFGSSRPESTTSSNGIAETTSEHSAPEILVGGPPSVAADVYALASTVFTLLNGSPPFGVGTDDGAVTASHSALTKNVPNLRRKGVPDDVCAALEWGMQAAPESRPRSALEFAESLQAARIRQHRSPIAVDLEAAPGNPQAAATVGPSDVAIRRRWSRKVIAALLLAAAIVIGAAGGGVLLLVHPFEPTVPTAALVSYFNASIRDRYETTLGSAPSGYAAQQTLGYLMTQDVLGASALYSCVFGSDHFLSPDPMCEGYPVIGKIGYVYTSQPSAPSAPLYRCWTKNHADHFVSNDPYCEGQILYGFLGYALRSP